MKYHLKIRLIFAFDIPDSIAKTLEHHSTFLCFRQNISHIHLPKLQRANRVYYLTGE